MSKYRLYYILLYILDVKMLINNYVAYDYMFNYVSAQINSN